VQSLSLQYPRYALDPSKDGSMSKLSDSGGKAASLYDPDTDTMTEMETEDFEKYRLGLNHGISGAYNITAVIIMSVSLGASVLAHVWLLWKESRQEPAEQGKEATAVMIPLSAFGRQKTKNKNHFFDTTVVKCLVQEGQLLAASRALEL